MQTHFDLIVIGSGPGGYVAAIRAAQLGMQVAIVEREAAGGICLNWGCIPTKALLKSAQVWQYLQHAEDYGIQAKGAKVDFSAMIKRSRKVADTMSKGIDHLFKKNNITLLQGHGKLITAETVAVTDKKKKTTQYTARNILLATGARSRELPHVPIDGKHILGYREVLSLKQQPKSMVVMGAGAIGVEFAYFYNAIGTKVTLVEYAPSILPLEDSDISQALHRQLQKTGIDMRLSTEVTGVTTSSKGCQVALKKGEKTETISSECVLSAVGIAPNIENLGLEDVGVEVERGRVTVDEYYATNIPRIHAIGDLVPGPALAHVASAEGILCVEQLAGLNPTPLNYNNLPGCTYCQPEVASVGYTEQAAKEAGYQVKVGMFPFAASGKAHAAGHPEGMVKVIFDAEYGEWLGAHMLGAGVTELIAEVVVARQLETTGHEIIKSVHPHPTLSEAVMEAVAAAYQESVHI